MILAQFINLVGLGFVTAEVFDGLGRHMYYLQPDQRRRFQIIGWLDWMQTFITIMFTKISICLFLKRIKNDRTNRLFVYTLIAANVLVTAVMCFLFLGMCRPLHAYWDVGVEGKCFSTHQVEAMVAAQGGLSLHQTDDASPSKILTPSSSILRPLRPHSRHNATFLPTPPPDKPPNENSPLRSYGRRIYHGRLLACPYRPVRRGPQSRSHLVYPHKRGMARHRSEPWYHLRQRSNCTAAVPLLQRASQDPKPVN